MNRYITSLAVLLLAVNLGTAQAQARIEFPGTGVRMVAPPGMALAPAGTALMDDAGETIIIITQSDAKSNLENDPRWRQLYRNPPERVSEKNIAGNLYRRTRVADGGAWDGWYFSALRGNKNLTMMVSYTGNSPEVFNRLRHAILTLTWDDAKSDPELAIGVKLAPSGLQLVRGVFGALSYNETGRVGTPGPSLLVQALPVSLSTASLMFPAGCDKVLGAIFPANAMVGPNQVQNGGVRLCEAWSKTGDPDMRYMALVSLPNGGLLSVMGLASSAKFDEMLPKFRVAVRDLKATKRRQ